MSIRMKIAILALLFSGAAMADRDDWGGHRHWGRFYAPYPPAMAYYPPPAVVYQPPVYYAPPAMVYSPYVAPGAAGGMAGSALGYAFSGGNPVAAGIGAAAGAWLGNGMGR